MHAEGFEPAYHAAGCVCSWEVWGLVGVGDGYFYDPGGHQCWSRLFKASSNCAARRVAHVLGFLVVLYPTHPPCFTTLYLSVSCCA